jgi:uncharacterized membrane protein
MAKARLNRRSVLGKPYRIVRGHIRLFFAIAVGIAVYVATAGQGYAVTRFLLAWDTGAILYLVMAAWAFATFDLKRLRDRCAEEDEGAAIMLVCVIGASIASLGAIVAFLGGAKAAGNEGGLNFAFAVLTIVLSWMLIHTMFAFHYAHEFYGEGADRKKGGLNFPGDPRPDYWDFAYFSFVIGMTFQVSDVQVRGKFLRHIVLLHGIVSFFFSVAILALAVNIGSNLIG